MKSAFATPGPSVLGGSDGFVRPVRPHVPTQIGDDPVASVSSPTMGAGLLLATAIGCLACLGAVGAQALRVDSLIRRWLAGYVIAWAALVAITALLSAPGWLDRWSLLVSLAAAAAGALGVRLWRGTRSPPSPRPNWREPLADPIVCTLTVVLVVAGLYLGALTLFTTPNDWDGLTYHETRALLWDQQGRIGYVAVGNEPRLNGNPPASEIGLYLTMAIPRSERYAAVPQYLAFWVSLIAVMLISRIIGLSRPAAAYSGLVFGGLPVVLLHGGAVLNDLLVASFLLVALVFLLGRTTTELALGSLALGLALSTKFTAILTLPLVLVVVLAGSPRNRRARATVAYGAGVALGSPWYLLNLVETGLPDGDLADRTGQSADLSFGALVGSLRALGFDVVDTSGIRGDEIVIACVAGLALCIAGVLRSGRSNGSARTLVAAGLLTVFTPLLLRSIEPPVRYVWEHGWFKLGREDIALDHGDAWKVLDVPDTSLSWYGVVGAIVILGGVAVAAIGVQKGGLPKLGLLLALAPAILIAVFAVTIVYDPWRGRLMMFAVGLACSAWGWSIRFRGLATGVAALSVVTIGLSLVHSFTKPSGFGVFERPSSESVWRRDRIESFTVIRNYDWTPWILREVEDRVPATAELAIATPMDTFLAPLAGPHLTRTLRLVSHGERVPAEATWLVVRRPMVATGCADAWGTVVSAGENDWRLLQRFRPDTCGPRIGGL